MTPEKVREVIELYRLEFIRREIPKKPFPPSDEVFFTSDALEHCHAMLDQMCTFLDEGRLEKAFRWLGFIQGSLWTEGIYSLDELKEHNRSDCD